MARKSLVILLAVTAVILSLSVSHVHGWTSSPRLLDASTLARLTIPTFTLSVEGVKDNYNKVQGNLRTRMSAVKEALVNICNTQYTIIAQLLMGVKQYNTSLMTGFRNWRLSTVESVVAMSQVEGAQNVIVILGIVYLVSLLLVAAPAIWVCVHHGVYTSSENPAPQLDAAARLEPSDAAVISLQVLMTAAADGIIADLAPLLRAAAKPRLLQHLQNKNVDSAVSCLDWDKDIQTISAISGVNFEDNPNVGNSGDYNNFNIPFRRERKARSIALALMLVTNITMANARKLLDILPGAVTVPSRVNNFENMCKRLHRGEPRYRDAWDKCKEVIEATLGRDIGTNELKNVQTAAVLVAALLLQKLA